VASAQGSAQGLTTKVTLYVFVGDALASGEPPHHVLTLLDAK